MLFVEQQVGPDPEPRTQTLGLATATAAAHQNCMELGAVGMKMGTFLVLPQQK